MKRMTWLPVGVAVGLLLGLGTSEALLPDFSKEQLIQQSEAIVLGTVLDQKSSWTEDRAQIFTYVTLLVADQYKGKPVERELILQIPGGKVGDITSKVSDTPVFIVGQQVIVHAFLQNTGYFWIYGWEKGVLEVENNGIPSYNMTLEQFRHLVETTN